MERTLAGPMRQMWLLSLAALLQVMWQAALENFPRTRVGGMNYVLWRRVKGHIFPTVFYWPNCSLPPVIGDPMPAHQRDRWTQYANTNKCMTFCALMRPAVEEVLRYRYPGARVRWLSCKVKPRSFLVQHGMPNILAIHCVLQITLPDHKEPWILDGTVYQYGYDPTKICVMPQSEYKAMFLFPNTDFEEISDDDAIEYTEGIMNYGKYWPTIKKRMEKLWKDDLDVKQLSKQTVSDIFRDVLPKAQEAFRGAYQEANPHARVD